jgi:opacity protein-like surface antigen
MKRSFTKVVLIGLGLICMASATHAETTVDFGVKGGLNFANLSTDNGFEIEDSVFVDMNSRMGMAGGAFVAFNVAKGVAIQAEFLYSQKGAKFDTTLMVETIPVDAEFTFKLDYIEIPVLLRYSIPTQSSVSPVLFAGPALAIKSTSKLKLKASAYGQSASETVDIEDVKSTDFGFVFGGGLDIALGRGKLVFDGRYTLGLTSVDDSPYEEDIKNKAISVTAGYAFPVGQ